MTYATSPTTTDTEEAGTGYQLCEFCAASGDPQSNPASICDCTPIERVVAGPSTPSGRFDTIIRIAETALIEHWAAFWDHSAILTKSVVPGQCGDEYSVHITFEGTINENLAESYQTDDGVARITGFTGDGQAQIGVTLAEDLDNRDTE